MNDQKITDDLLDELEQLEASADALEDQVNHNKEKQEQFQKLDSANQIDAISLAVEAARTAQEAASQSQKAAETSLNHANRQKTQIMELSEGNFAWRQATKVANSELKSAKSSFAIMLTANVVLGVAAASAIGWMLYDMHKKQLQFKGEVLDIIQTENGLLNKQITIKVDQISSLLELLTAEIQRMKPPRKEQHLSTMVPAPQPDPTAMPEETTKQADQVPPSNTESTVPSTATTETADVKETLPKSESASIAENEQYANLKTLLDKILDEQQKLQAKTLAATQQGITEQQAKQLKDINWLVSKQSKTLNEIKQNLAKQSGTTSSTASPETNKETLKNYKLIQQSLEELKAQLKTITTQQNSLQSQVKALNDEPKPYSYHVKP